MTANAIVSVENVVKLYRQGALESTALAGVSVEILSGSFVAICGPSGSGKTTLLNLIGALDRPSSGTVKIGQRDLGTLSRHELSILRRDQIGFVFQAYNLIPVYSAVENAEFTMGLQKINKKERRERAMQALADVGLTGLDHRLPRELSGGQQQRVAVARAIASRPEVVLADEPTANLDSKTAHSLLDLMQKLNQEKNITFVFSTHDNRIIQRANRAIWLQDGKITFAPVEDSH